jgi:hypothetical protein
VWSCRRRCLPCPALCQSLALGISPSHVPHLLCLQRVVGRLDGHVLVAIDLDTVCDDGLGLALVVEGGGDGAHLSGSELEPVSIHPTWAVIFSLSLRETSLVYKMAH